MEKFPLLTDAFAIPFIDHLGNVASVYRDRSFSAVKRSFDMGSLASTASMHSVSSSVFAQTG